MIGGNGGGVQLIERSGLNGWADHACAETGQTGAEALAAHALDAAATADGADGHGG